MKKCKYQAKTNKTEKTNQKKTENRRRDWAACRRRARVSSRATAEILKIIHRLPAASAETTRSKKNINPHILSRQRGLPLPQAAAGGTDVGFAAEPSTQLQCAAAVRARKVELTRSARRSQLEGLREADPPGLHSRCSSDCRAGSSGRPRGASSVPRACSTGGRSAQRGAGGRG